MNVAIRRSVPFGELVTTVFDEAAHHSADPMEVASMAARAVDRLLRRTPYRPSPRKCHPYGDPSAGKEAACGFSSS